MKLTALLQILQNNKYITKWLIYFASILVLFCLFTVCITVVNVNWVWDLYNWLSTHWVIMDFVPIYRWFLFNIVKGNYFLNYFGADGAVFNLVGSSSGLFPEIFEYPFALDNKEWLFSTAWYSPVSFSGPLLIFMVFYVIDAFLLQPTICYLPKYIQFIEEESLPYLPPDFDDEDEIWYWECWWEYFHMFMSYALVAATLAAVQIDSYFWLLEFRYDYSSTLITNAWDVHVDIKAVSRLRLEKYREAYDTYSKLLLTQAQNHVFLQTFLDVLQIRYGPTAGQYFYLTPHTSFSAEPFYLSQYNSASLNDLNLSLSTAQEVFSSFKDYIKPDRNTFSALSQVGATFEEGYVESRWVWNDFLFFVDVLADLPTLKPVWSIIGEDILKWPRTFSVARSRWSEFIGDIIPHHQVPVTSHNPYNYLFYAYKPQYAATLDFLEKLLFKGISLDYFSILQNYMRPRIDNVHENSPDFLRLLTGIHSKAAYPGIQKRNYHHYANGDLELNAKRFSGKKGRLLPTSYFIVDKELEQWAKTSRSWDNRVRKRALLQRGDTFPDVLRWKFKRRFYKMLALAGDGNSATVYDFYGKNFFKPGFHLDEGYFVHKIKSLRAISEAYFFNGNKQAYAPFISKIKGKDLPHVTRAVKKVFILDFKNSKYLIEQNSHYLRIYYFLNLFNYNKKTYVSLFPCDYLKKNPALNLLWKNRVLPNRLGMVNALGYYNLKYYKPNLLESLGSSSYSFGFNPRGFDYGTFYLRASKPTYTKMLRGYVSMKNVFWSAQNLIKPYYKITNMDTTSWISTYQNLRAMHLTHLPKFFKRNPFFSDNATLSGELLGQVTMLQMESAVDTSDGGVSAWEPLWTTGSKIKTPLAYIQPRSRPLNSQVFYNRDSIPFSRNTYAKEFRNYFYRWLTWFTHRPYTELGDQGYISYPARKTRVSWQMPIYRRYRRLPVDMDITSHRFLNANPGRLMRPYAVTWTDTWRRGIVWDVPNHLHVGALHFAWPFAFDRAGLVPVEWFYSRFTRNDFALNYSLIEWWSPDLRLTKTPSFASTWYRGLADHIVKTDDVIPQLSKFYLFAKRHNMKTYAYITRNQVLHRNALIQQLASWRLGTSYHFYSMLTGLSFDSKAPYSDSLSVFIKPTLPLEPKPNLVDRFNPFRMIPKVAYPVKFFDWLLGTPDDPYQSDFLKTTENAYFEFKGAPSKWKVLKGKIDSFEPAFKKDKETWKTQVQSHSAVSSITAKYLKTGELPEDFKLLHDNLVKKADKANSGFLVDFKHLKEKKIELAKSKPSFEKFSNLGVLEKQEYMVRLMRKDLRLYQKARLWHSTVFDRTSTPHFLKSLPKDPATFSDFITLFKRLVKALKLQWKSDHSEVPTIFTEDKVKKENIRKNRLATHAWSRLSLLTSDPLSLNMSPVKKVGDMLQLFTKRKPVVIKYAVSSSKTVSLWLSNSLGSRWPSYVSMHLPTSSSFELSGSLSKLVSTHFSVRSLQSGIFSQVPRSHLDSLSRSHFYEGRLLSSLAVRAHKPIPAYVEYTHALFEHNYKPVTAGTFLAYHQAPSKYGLMNAILRRFYNAQARPVYFYSFKVMGAINSSPYRYCFVSSVPLRFLSDDFYAVYDRFLSLSSRFKNVIRVGFFSSIIEFFAPGLIADISRLSFEMPSDTILRISLCEEFWHLDFDVSWAVFDFSKLWFVIDFIFFELLLLVFLAPLFYVFATLLKTRSSINSLKTYPAQFMHYIFVSYVDFFFYTVWSIFYLHRFARALTIRFYRFCKNLFSGFIRFIKLFIEYQIELEEEAFVRDYKRWAGDYHNSFFKGKGERKLPFVYRTD